MPYVVSQMPQTDDVEALRKWVEEEFRRVERALAENDLIVLSVTNIEPPRPRAGMVAFADGTNWNPGSGRGLYQYKTNSWVAL